MCYGVEGHHNYSHINYELKGTLAYKEETIKAFFWIDIQEDKIARFMDENE